MSDASDVRNMSPKLLQLLSSACRVVCPCFATHMYSHVALCRRAPYTPFVSRWLPHTSYLTSLRFNIAIIILLQPPSSIMCGRYTLPDGAAVICPFRLYATVSSLMIISSRKFSLCFLPFLPLLWETADPRVCNIDPYSTISLHGHVQSIIRREAVTKPSLGHMLRYVPAQFAHTPLFSQRVVIAPSPDASPGRILFPIVDNINDMFGWHSPRAIRPAFLFLHDFAQGCYL
jgi:hypothetical protein